LQGEEVPLAPTHWSFGQLTTMIGAPATYLRQLPAPLAASNLQYGLSSHRAELIKTLQARSARRLVIATKAAMGAAEPARDLPMTDHDDNEPPHAESATDLVLNELQLFGHRPFDDQPDPRPLPQRRERA
jgi:hypothetical protein